ncbi:MAG: LamG-like jellyroll fold domain-containing protein [Sulfurospirillaceae bacterium]|nr:LamG-like jellyroll fold domain-containing protein [Sulfurospirillaceae bacterium]
MVDNTPSGVFSCVNTSHPYNTIQGALNASRHGDTIEICSGTYNESLNINENDLTIKGVSGQAIDDVVINAGNNIGITLSKKNITLENFKLISTNNYGIYGDNHGKGDHVFRKLIIEAGNRGIYLTNGNKQTFEDLNITAGDIGIYTSYDVKGDHTYNNITINSKDNAIQADNGGLSFENLNLTSTNGMGIDIGNTSKDLLFQHIAISSKNEGIYTTSNVSGQKIFNDINISSQATGISVNGGKQVSLDYIDVNSSNNMGIYLAYNAWGNHTFNHIKVNSKSEAVYVANGGLSFQNMDLNSTTDRGLDIENTNNDLTIDNITIQSQKEGIYAPWDVNGNSILKNITINSLGSGISFARGFSSLSDANITSRARGVDTAAYRDMVIDNVDINTSSGTNYGILLNWGDSNAKITIQNSKISAGDDGIHTNNGYLNIDSVCINGAKRGIYIPWNVYNAVVKNTVIKNTTDVDLELSSSTGYPASITNNCFYGSALANSNSTVHYFDSNYWDGFSGTVYKSGNVVDNHPKATCTATGCGGSTSVAPLVDYWFDECSWSGVSGEVKDSSGNGYNATAMNGLDTNSSGKVYRGATFNGTDHYIYAQGIASYLQKTASLGFWIKTTQTGNNTDWLAPGISGIEQNGGTNDIFWGWLDATGHIHITKGNGNGAESTNPINDDLWHHVVLTRDSSTGQLQVYVDGNLNQTSFSDSGDVTTNFSSIGRIENTNSSILPKYFHGSLDEVEIYNRVLSASEIKTIYDNENVGKNYDGSTRVAPTCTALKECFSDNFNRTSLGDKWSIISTGTHPPDVTDNKLMLTKNIGNISSGVSLVGSFPSNNNIIQIEFEGNAYAGSGADGVSVILSDANTTPVAGGFGGSLGYAPKNEILGFAGAWLGFGLDEYGNFADDNDGNKGRGCTYRPTSRILDSLTIRGRGDSNRLNGYCFIANSGNLATSTGVGIDDTSSATPAPKSNYKFIIDTRNNQTLITVYRDIHDGNGYVLLPNMNEVNATQNASPPANFRFSLTGSTGGSTNYHSIDDLNISALSCGTLGQIQNNKNNYFDAWEVGSAYNISNRVIKTKIVKKNFTLNVVALNETNTDYQDFNGTVCARVVDSSSNKILSGWVKLLFDASHPYINTATFNSDYASRDARIDLSWKKGVDTTCPITNEDNSTRSTDNFAIRPSHFTFDTNSTTLYAGVPFKLDINATNNSGNNSLDYNETNGTSYSVGINDSNATCPSGTLSNVPNPLKFSDGLIALNTKYSEVGDVNITIKENLGSEFALVDQNDTSAIDRLIPATSKTITFNPYKFSIINYNFTRNPDQDWRYMSDVKDANISLSFKVQAQNADGVVTKKFDYQCYSKAVDVKIDLNSTSSDGNVSYFQLINNSSTYGNDKNLSDFNFNGTINDQNFTEGNSSTVQYALNVHREYNVPKNPLTISGVDINTSYPSDSNVINQGLVLDNNNSQFYYGRLSVNDIDTNQHSAIFNQKIEVYSSATNTYVSGFHQDSTNWYQMQKDNLTVMNALLPKVDFTLNLDKVGIDDITTTQNTLLGVDSFTITNHWTNADSAYIHIKVPTYLWYNQYKAYSDNNASDCSTHPCFRYNFFLNQGTSGLIQSGDFNGTDIGSDYNQSTYIKSGVKVFR